MEERANEWKCHRDKEECEQEARSDLNALKLGEFASLAGDVLSSYRRHRKDCCPCFAMYHALMDWDV